jgi:predicted acetyltransferase
VNIDVARASVEEKPLIQRMLELYEYDFSEYEGTDLDSHGCFGYPNLDLYWLEPTRHPFIVRVDGRLAGFVLVNQRTYLESSEWGI